MAVNTTSLFEHFHDLEDPRSNRGNNHSLFEMVVISVVATACGANYWTDVERFGNSKFDWFQKYLELENGIPSHDTFSRVFARLESDNFLSCLQNWIHSLDLDMTGQAVAIDGKTLRHSFDNATGNASLHVVNAWACGLRLCLGQIAVSDKSNEITAVPKLLEFLDLKGAVVTLDAMHCQTETVAAIQKQGADYVLTVKRNQLTLFNTLDDLFLKQDVPIRRHTTKDKGHNREEIREYSVAPVPEHLKSKWKGIQSVGMVFRTVTDLTSGETTEELAYFISSLPPKVRALSKYVRGHWQVETTLHWSLDVTFAEDTSRIRKGNGPEITSIFRRLALTLLQQDETINDNIRGKRLRAGWDDDVLDRFFAGFFKN
jgi:predicted transposase YbfD/YdcC